MSYRTLGFPDYGVTNASNCKWGFTPDSNPKMGNTKKDNLKDINLLINLKERIFEPAVVSLPNLARMCP